jgi:hypothetical protein
MTTASVPLPDALAVINIGLDVFAAELATQGAAIVHVIWQPPLGGVESVPALEALLDEVVSRPDVA